YFRAMFELKNASTGSAEFFVTGVLPALFLVFLITLPWIDRRIPRSLTTPFRYAVVGVSAFAWIGLTIVSFARDHRDPAFRNYLVEAHERADRARLIATIDGI